MDNIECSPDARAKSENAMKKDTVKKLNNIASELFTLMSKVMHVRGEFEYVFTDGYWKGKIPEKDVKDAFDLITTAQSSLLEATGKIDTLRTDVEKMR